MINIVRKIAQMLTLGRSTTPVTDGGKVRTVQAKILTHGDTRDAVPYMLHYGVTSRPHAGADFIVLALDNNPGKSVAIASNDQNYQISLVEGEVALHDDSNQKVHITRDGLVIVGLSKVTMTAPVVETSGNLLAGTGASGSFTTPLGATVTVRDGIITNIY